MMTHTLRARASARSILIAAVCAAAVTACGSTQATGGSAAGHTAAGAHAARVSLTIQVTGKAGTKPKHWTLRCDPAGGTHPDPQAACGVLMHAKSPFAAVPDHAMCPMIRVGTKTATVKGTWFGKHIDTSFTRNGCGLLRWKKVGQIFN
jgi:Subtilisin inhibitor-like